MDAQPHSRAWEQQHCWHRGGDLAAVSVVLSPKLLSTGVTTRPQGLSEAGGLWVGGAQPDDEADCSYAAGTQPCCSQEASGQEEVTPTLSSRPYPHVGSLSTGHTPVSCSLSLPFHTHVRGLHIGCLAVGPQLTVMYFGISGIIPSNSPFSLKP